MLVVGIVVCTLSEFGWRRTASAAARTAASSAIFFMCAVPFMGWNDEAFTDRGVIWRASLTEWSSRAFLSGFGSDWFQLIAGSDTSPLTAASFHGHNQFVQFLATGGVMFAFLAVGSLLVQMYAITVPTNQYLAIGAVLVTGIAASGVLEVGLGYVDTSVFWTVTIVPLAVLFLARPTDTRCEIGTR